MINTMNMGCEIMGHDTFLQKIGRIPHKYSNENIES